MLLTGQRVLESIERHVLLHPLECVTLGYSESDGSVDQCPIVNDDTYLISSLNRVVGYLEEDAAAARMNVSLMHLNRYCHGHEA